MWATTEFVNTIAMGAVLWKLEGSPVDPPSPITFGMMGSIIGFKIVRPEMLIMHEGA